jgi:hypothetical protein
MNELRSHASIQLLRTRVCKTSPSGLHASVAIIIMLEDVVKHVEQVLDHVTSALLQLT